MTCPAFKTVQTGLFSTATIRCSGKHKPNRPHACEVPPELCKLLGVSRAWVKWLD